MTFDPSVKKPSDIEAPVISPEEMARELQAAYEKLTKERLVDDPGLTTKEYAKFWGRTISPTRRRLEKLRKAGLIITGYRYIERRDGHGMQPIPVYRLKKGEDEE